MKLKNNGIKLRLDTSKIPIEAVMKKLMEFGTIEDITIRNPSMDEIIAHIYRGTDFLSNERSSIEVPAKI